MLPYLGHSHSEISVAIHQCARYTHSPKQSHEDTLKRIECYLKGTLDKGLILNPGYLLKIDCCPHVILQDCGHKKINKIHIVCKVRLVMLYFGSTAWYYGRASFKLR